MPTQAILDSSGYWTGVLISNGWATQGIVTVQGNDTPLSPAAVVLVNATGGPITITLADATQAPYVTGQRYTIIKTDPTANGVTVTGTNGQTIGGAGSAGLAAGNAFISVVVVSSKKKVWAATATSASQINGVTVTGAPTAGQTLTATSPTAADWQNAPVDWVNVVSLGADPTGAGDSTTVIQGALNAAGLGQVVYLPAGTYKTSATLTVPSGVALTGPSSSFGVSFANYGLGGLPLQGAIIQPSSAFSGAFGAGGIITLSGTSAQGGGQLLENISIDGSNLPPANNLHGILISNAVACVTISHVTVYGGSGHNLGGDCLHAAANPNHPPDLLNIFSCHFAGAAGWGASLNGVADSYITISEATACTSGGWNIINCNNTRFAACKGEQCSAGPGWLFTAASGFTGIVHVLGCTSQSNDQDGFRVTGPGTGTYQMTGCSGDSDGTNGGGGGGGFAGLNVTSFSGTVLADGFANRVTGSSPQYGVSMTSSNVLKVDNANIAGQ